MLHHQTSLQLWLLLESSGENNLSSRDPLCHNPSYNTYYSSTSPHLFSWNFSVHMRMRLKNHVASQNVHIYPGTTPNLLVACICKWSFSIQKYRPLPFAEKYSGRIMSMPLHGDAMQPADKVLSHDLVWT